MNVQVAAGLGRISDVLGGDRVVFDPLLVQAYSVDFSEQPGALAVAVVRPVTTQEVSLILKIAGECGFSVNVRGGGMSYTLGYVPQNDVTIILDMSGLNRIIEVNVVDLYVIVEAGVTWKELAKALKGSGRHIPFGGTLSGERATIGGGLANGAAGVKKGEITDHIMGLEVVLADGRVVTTGSLATARPMQPMRYYGPDLTGLFIHDAGSLGVKTRAVFRLYPAPEEVAYACFGFHETAALVDAMCEIGRTGLASENMAFGRYHNRMFAAQPIPPPAERKVIAQAVRDASPTWAGGLFNLLRLARPGGLKYLADWAHTLMIIVDAESGAAARANMRKLRRIALKAGGKSLPSKIAIVMRAMPFQPVEQLIVGWQIENNSFPSNRIVRFSDGRRLAATVQQFWLENADIMKRHGIVATELYVAVNATIGVEPIFFWRDAMNPLRLSITGARRAELAAIPADIAVRSVVLELRRKLVDRLGALPGAHYQIGKYYSYQRDLVSDENRQVLRQLKKLLDPRNTLNPGGLGSLLSHLFSGLI
jgi:D-lactate dehydrogenase (cytochrome)